MRDIPDLLSLSEARELAMASGRSETDICRALREGKIRFKGAFERVTLRGHTVDPELFRRMAFEDRNRFRLRVPEDLAAEDVDWENSRPRKPWPLGEGYFAHIDRLQLSRRDHEKVFSLVEIKASNQAREETSEADAKRKRAEAKRKLKRAEERGARTAREEASQADAERKRAEAKRKRKLAETKRKRKRAKELAAREEASHASDTSRAQPRRDWARKASNGAYPNGVPTKEEVPNKTFISEVMKFVKVMKSTEPKGWDVGGPDTILRAVGRRK